MGKLRYIKEYFEFAFAYKGTDGSAMLGKDVDLMKFRDVETTGSVGHNSFFISNADANRFPIKDDLYFDPLDASYPNGQQLKSIKSIKNNPSEEMKKISRFGKYTEEQLHNYRNLRDQHLKPIKNPNDEID